MRPLVSIVVPSFQQAAFLRTAIDSILAQDGHPLEVLVMDGGSTDGSRSILASYGDRIRYRSEPDGGQAAAINEGFRSARGEFVAWLNSDDFYYPGAVAAAVAALRARPDAALVYGEGDLVDARGQVLRRFPETVPFDLWQLAHVADYILQPTVFLRRRAVVEHGMLDQRLRWGLDWDLWLRLGSRQPLCYTPQVLAASRLHDATKTHTGGWRRLRELRRILAAHGVPATSPAMLAHAASTAARARRPSHDPITADGLVGSLPRGTRRLGTFVAGRFERWLRHRLQNAQGLWRDGQVGRRGRLWLPADAAGEHLRVVVRNHAIRGQVVTLGAGALQETSAVLEPGQSCVLGVELPAAPAGPIEVQLRCARVTRIAPLDPRLGPRYAGCSLREASLLSSPHSMQPRAIHATPMPCAM